jgi:hypothetical protein
VKSVFIAEFYDFNGNLVRMEYEAESLQEAEAKAKEHAAKSNMALHDVRKA